MGKGTIDSIPVFDPNKPFTPVKDSGVPAFDPSKPFEPVKKKEVSEPISLGKFGAVPSLMPSLNGGIVGSSKSPTVESKIGIEKYTPEDISVFNREFEIKTGHDPLDLSEPGKATNILDEQRVAKKTKDYEQKQFLKNRAIEKYEITPVLQNVYSGTIQPKELSTLYNKPYGKKIVSDIINQQVPEVGSMALGSDVFGNEAKWGKIADAIQLKNRQQGVDAQNQYEFNLDAEINNVLKNQKLGNNLGAAETRHGGGEDIFDFKETSTSSPEQLGELLRQIKKADYVTGGIDKNDLVEKVQARMFFIKAGEPLHPEINTLSNEISEATKNLSSAGWKNKGITTEQKLEYEKIDEGYIKAGLNYLRDADPGKYKNIMRAIGGAKTIADIDYQNLVEIGKKIKNQQEFKQGEIVKDDDRDFSTYQTRRADISLATSERLKEKGYKNAGRINDNAIVETMVELGIDPKSEESLAIRRDEASGGYGIVKGGGLTSLMRGVAGPIKSINQSIGTLGNPIDTYLDSRRLDYGDQKVADAKGNVSDVLPSERKIDNFKNFFNKAVEGFGQFGTQILLARGIGGALQAPYNLAAMSVPRAALTAAQSTNIAAYGGGFLSTLAQTYGHSFIDFLQKTGDPDKAALMATIDAVGQSALEVGILPDVKIAESMKGALKNAKDKLAKGIIGVVEKGGKEEAAKPLVQSFIEETSKILGKEVLGEEAGQNLENYIVESIFSPKTARDRDLGAETEQVVKEAGVQMLIPAILGGFGNSKNQQVQKFTKDAFNSSAINFDEYKEALDLSLANGNTSQQDYNKAIKYISTHRQSIEKAPEVNSLGQDLPLNQQLDYAFQETLRKENQAKADEETDPIQKKFYEEKVREANKAKEEIFVKEEEKELAAVVDEKESSETTDEDLTPEQTKAAKILGLANLPDTLMVGAEQDPVGTLKDISYQAQGIGVNPETGAVEALKGGERRADLIGMGYPEKFIDQAVEMFPKPAENPPIDQVREMADENTVEKMMPIAEKMASAEMELSNIGLEIDPDYDGEIIVLDKRTGEQVAPEDIPNGAKKIVADYELATSKLSQFDEKAFQKSLEKARNQLKGEDADFEVINPKQLSDSPVNIPSNEQGGKEPSIKDKPVYHGTASDFDSFEIGDELGVHFGSKEQATDRLSKKKGGEGRVIESTISINNPIRLDDWGSDYDIARLADDLVDKNIITKEEAAKLQSEGTPKDIREILIKNGYDGIVYKNRNENKSNPTDSYVVFDKAQIKNETTTQASDKGNESKSSEKEVITEPIPDKDSKPAEKSRQQEVNDLMDDVTAFNKLPKNAKNRSAELNDLRVRANDLGLKFDDTRGRLFNDKGKRVTKVSADRPSSTSPDFNDADYSPEAKQHIETISKEPSSLFGLPIIGNDGRQLSITQINSALKAGKDGKPTRATKSVYDFIQDAIETGEIEVVDKATGQAVKVPVNEYFDMFKEPVKELTDAEIENLNWELSEESFNFNDEFYGQERLPQETEQSAPSGSNQSQEKTGSGKESSGTSTKQKEGIALAGKELAERLRGLKSKSDKLQANIFGIPIAIYDGAIEIIATAIENGAKLAEAISEGIKYIRDNGGRDLQQKEFVQHIEDFAAGEKPKVKVQVGEEEADEDAEIGEEGIDDYTMTTSGEVGRFLSGGTLEDVFGENPEGDQNYDIQKLSDMLQDGRNMIDIAAAKWGLDVMAYGKPLFEHIQNMSNDNQLTNKKAVLMATFLGEMKETILREPSRRGEIQPLYNAVEAYYQKYMNLRGKEIVAGRLLRLYRDKYVGDLFADRILEEQQVKDKKALTEAEQNRKVDDKTVQETNTVTKEQKDAADKASNKKVSKAKADQGKKKSMSTKDAKIAAEQKLEEIKGKTGDKSALIDKINEQIKKCN